MKAELLKKKQELQEQKNSVKRPVKRLKPETPLQPTITTTTNATTEDVLEQSKKALEAKSRLYSKLERGLVDEKDLSAVQRDGFLVDFTWKGWNAETEEYEFSDEQEEEAGQEGEGSDSLKPLSYQQVLELPVERDFDWIEMIDEFGRRRVMRPADLKSLFAERFEANRLCARYSAEGEELRNRGVGFYNFAVDEESRSRQMEALKRLRAETLESRTRALLMREQRRLQLERRLANLKKRES